MQISVHTIFALLVAAAAASSVPDSSPAVDTAQGYSAQTSSRELNVLEAARLEKRRACSGKRLQNDVCQGRFIYQGSSRHNCYRKDGKCCAKNKNRDYGIPVSNGSQRGEDCGYCFSGGCKMENP